MSERNRAKSPDLAKWTQAASTLYRTRDALRKQEPPRNDVAVPRVDNDFDRLVEQVTFDDLRLNDVL